MNIPETCGLVRETNPALSRPEREILAILQARQKTALSVAEFRTQAEQALREGWQGSGPLQASRVLAGAIQDLEHQVAQRLLAEKLGH